MILGSMVFVGCQSVPHTHWSFVQLLPRFWFSSLATQTRFFWYDITLWRNCRGLKLSRLDRYKRWNDEWRSTSCFTWRRVDNNDVYPHLLQLRISNTLFIWQVSCRAFEPRPLCHESGNSDTCFNERTKSLHSHYNIRCTTTLGSYLESPFFTNVRVNSKTE